MGVARIAIGEGNVVAGSTLTPVGGIVLVVVIRTGIVAVGAVEESLVGLFVYTALAISGIVVTSLAAPIAQLAHGATSVHAGPTVSHT